MFDAETSAVMRTAPPELNDVHDINLLESMCTRVGKRSWNPVHMYAVAHNTPPPLAAEQLMKSESDIKTVLPAAFKILPQPSVYMFSKVLDEIRTEASP